MCVQQVSELPPGVELGDSAQAHLSCATSFIRELEAQKIALSDSLDNLRKPIDLQLCNRSANLGVQVDEQICQVAGL